MKNKNRTEDNRKTLCSCCCIKWNLKKRIGNNKNCPCEIPNEVVLLYTFY